MRAVYLPINPKQCLLIHFWEDALSTENEKHVYYYNIPSDQVKLINHDTLKFADEKLFCFDRDYLLQFMNRTS
ncbi:MAG: hypothetical protein WKF87_19475 [Chryseolinea sp.]